MNIVQTTFLLPLLVVPPWHALLYFAQVNRAHICTPTSLFYSSVTDNIVTSAQAMIWFYTFTYSTSNIHCLPVVGNLSVVLQQPTCSCQKSASLVFSKRTFTICSYDTLFGLNKLLKFTACCAHQDQRLRAVLETTNGFLNEELSLRDAQVLQLQQALQAKTNCPHCRSLQVQT